MYVYVKGNMSSAKRIGHGMRALALAGLVALAFPLTATEAIPCDAYRVGDGSITRYSFRVVVAADESWQRFYGAAAEVAARQLVGEVDWILEPTGIDLVFADYRAWDSRGDEQQMIRLLDGLETSISADPYELVIGLTGRRVSRVDGIARTGHSHLVARHHPDRPQYDALVVAHEIGHLMGAEHHRCQHSYSCVMTPKGFELPGRWCGHHVRQVQLSVERLAAG